MRLTDVAADGDEHAGDGGRGHDRIHLDRDDGLLAQPLDLLGADGVDCVGECVLPGVELDDVDPLKRATPKVSDRPFARGESQHEMSRD